MAKRQTIIAVKNTKASSVPIGYGPNNPEPVEFKDSAKDRQDEITNNALHAAEAYIYHKS